MKEPEVHKQVKLQGYLYAFYSRKAELMLSLLRHDPQNFYKSVELCGLGSGRALFLGALRGTIQFQRS